MANMNMIQALNSAMDIMLGRDPSVVIMGEDVGYFGGVFRATEGLQRKYGEHRVIDTPIAEGGIVASGHRHERQRPAAGRRDPVRRLHLSGLRPDRERARAHPLPQRRRFLCARDHSHAVRRRHSRRPDAFAKSGRHLHARQRHQGGDAVQPLRCQRAADHLRSRTTIRWCSSSRSACTTDRSTAIPTSPPFPGARIPKGQVDEGYYKVPLGKADIVRAGVAVTIITYGTMVHVAVAAAAAHECRRRDHRSALAGAAGCRHDRALGEENRPLRRGARSDAVFRIRRGARCSIIQEECFWELEAPIQRVAGWDTPYPHAFEWEYFPGQARVKTALKTVMESA